MIGGLRPLRHPGTPADQIDVEGTQESRRLTNEAIRNRHLLIDQLERETITGPEADKDGPG